MPDPKPRTMYAVDGEDLLRVDRVMKRLFTEERMSGDEMREAAVSLCMALEVMNGIPLPDDFTTEEQPYFEHDCAKCIFLGKHTYHAPHCTAEREEYTILTTVDLYYCPNSESFSGGSLLARFNSEDSEYSSCPASLLLRDRKHREAEPSTHSPALLEALDRAIKRNLGNIRQLAKCERCGEYTLHLETHMADHFKWED
jgi:hypothetical protein